MIILVIMLVYIALFVCFVVREAVFVMKNRMREEKEREYLDNLNKYLDSLNKKDKFSDDMSKEREFMEKLVCQRFNYFLVFFAIIIASAVNAKTQLHFQLILSIGTIISSLIACTIWSANYVLNEIFNNFIWVETSIHPAKKLKGLINYRANMRNFIGYYIPIFCCILLAVGSIFSCFIYSFLNPQ